MEESYSYPSGMVPTQLWRAGDGWRFDGPSANGPKRIRSNPKGICWSGPVTEDEAGEIREAIENANRRIGGLE